MTTITAKEWRQQGWPIPDSVPDEAVGGIRAYCVDVEQDAKKLLSDEQYCHFESRFRGYFEWKKATT